MANGKQMAPLDTTQDFKLTYDKTSGVKGAKKGEFIIDSGTDVLASNGFYSRKYIKDNAFDAYSPHGYMDVYNQDTISREVLFFTKPDLNIFNVKDPSACTLENMNSDLNTIPFFQDAWLRHPKCLMQLQSSVRDSYNQYNPFMYLLSNRVTSKLDLPSISADSQSSTSNLFSTEITYRTHSFKSDQAYDFSLTFKDTATLDIYWLTKIYDEYMKMIRFGEVSPKFEYITNRVLSEQFSIYKFILSQDGETILYWAKLTGVYFTDVPRSDFGDPSLPLSYSLSFHAQFVEDNDISLLRDFNIVSGTNEKYTENSTFVNIYDGHIGGVKNNFVYTPCVVQYTDSRAERFGTGNSLSSPGLVYRLKWVDMHS